MRWSSTARRCTWTPTGPLPRKVLPSTLYPPARAWCGQGHQHPPADRGVQDVGVDIGQDPPDRRLVRSPVHPGERIPEHAQVEGRGYRRRRHFRHRRLNRARAPEGIRPYDRPWLASGGPPPSARFGRPAVVDPDAARIMVTVSLGCGTSPGATDPPGPRCSCRRSGPSGRAARRSPRRVRRCRRASWPREATMAPPNFSSHSAARRSTAAAVGPVISTGACGFS